MQAVGASSELEFGGLWELLPRTLKGLRLDLGFRISWIWGFPTIGGTLFGGPYSKDPTI